MELQLGCIVLKHMPLILAFWFIVVIHIPDKEISGYSGEDQSTRWRPTTSGAQRCRGDLRGEIYLVRG